MQRRNRATLLVALLAAAIPAATPGPAEAGGWRKGRVTVGGNAGPALAGVPVWAANQMRQAGGTYDVPAQPGGRRPWAYALNQRVDTPAARMARYYQLGGGVGPTPDASNGPGGYFVPYSTFNYPYP